MHNYEIQLCFSSVMDRDAVIASIEELLPGATYQVAEAANPDE